MILCQKSRMCRLYFVKVFIIAIVRYAFLFPALEDSGGKERAPSTASSETLSAKSDSNLAIPSETELQSKSDITQATGKQTTSDMKITPAPTVVRLTSDGIITLSPPVADKSETDAAVLSLTNDGQPANIDENMEKVPRLGV